MVQKDVVLELPRTAETLSPVAKSHFVQPDFTSCLLSLSHHLGSTMAGRYLSFPPVQCEGRVALRHFQARPER